jgi:hypothetical protein
LRRGPWGIGIVGVGIVDDEVTGVAAADPRRLHAPRGGEVGRTKAHALHPRAGVCDLLDVDNALRRLQESVDQDRPLDLGLRLELGKEAVDIVDVPWALDFRDHDHV